MKIMISDDSSGDASKKLQKDFFYKQQQQRLQNINLKKDVSADDLIRNILEKVDSDAKISKFTTQSHQRNTHTGAIKPQENKTFNDSNFNLQVPQCFLMSHELPFVYLHVWDAVKPSDGLTDFCDRDKLYQILLLSNLPSNVLAQLWAYVNRTIPGQLTKNELFIMLALIALIQNNHSDPVNELYRTTVIPLPTFVQLPQSENNPFLEKDISSTENVQIASLSCDNSHSNPIAETTNGIFNHDDEFSEFISAEPDSVEQPDQPSSNLQYFDNSTNLTSPPPPLLLNSGTDANQTNDFFNERAISFQDASSNSGLSDNMNQFTEGFADFYLEDSKIEHNNAESISDNTNQNDRYSSLRKLTHNHGASDDFGNFYSHSTSQNDYDCDITTEDPMTTNITLKECAESREQNRISNKRKILSACKQVMHKTFNVLIVNHGQESVIEALNSKDGANFVIDLKETYAMAERIKNNLNILESPIEIDLCDSLFDEVRNNWNSISNVIRKSSINLEELKPVLADSATKSTEHCSICSNECSQAGSLLFAGFRYHISCANFWLNFVDSSLPHKHYDDF